MPGACLFPALCVSHIHGTHFSARLAWHFSVQSLVTSWIEAAPVQPPAAILLFISLEIILAWNKGELKQFSCSSILRDCCTVHHSLCLEQIPGLAQPLSSRSCMSHWWPGYLCDPGSAAVIQNYSPLCSWLLLPWLSLPPELSAESHSAHVPSCGCGFCIKQPCFFFKYTMCSWDAKTGLCRREDQLPGSAWEGGSMLRPSSATVWCGSQVQNLAWVVSQSCWLRHLSCAFPCKWWSAGETCIHHIHIAHPANSPTTASISFGFVSS